MLRAPGKPLHPPLTDASIGAYTAGVVMLVLGALGVEEEQMAHGALLAISLGLASGACRSPAIIRIAAGRTRAVGEAALR